MARLGFKAAWDFGRAVAGLARGGESARSATVTSVDEDGTVWVRMAGAESDVPLDGTLASAQVGDTVTVGWRGGAPAGEGNASDPSAGGRSVSVVRESARIAQAVAQEAQAVADAIGQHFFADDNGVHVTEAEGQPDTEHNILINSLGILLRKAMAPLVSITQSAIAFYDGLGNTASNIVARFGADGSQIGKSDESHVEIDAGGMDLVNAEGEDALRMRTDFAVYRHVESYYRDSEVSSLSSLPVTIPEIYGLDFADVLISVDIYEGGLTPAVLPTITTVDESYMETFAAQTGVNDGRGVWWDVVGSTIIITDVPASQRAEIEAALAGGDETIGVTLEYTTRTQGVSALSVGSRAGDIDPSGVLADPAPNSATFGEYLRGDIPNSVTVGRYDSHIVPSQRDNGVPLLKVGAGDNDNTRRTVWYADDNGHMYAAKGADFGTPLPVESGGTGSDSFGTILTEDISTAVSVPHGSSWHTLGSVDLARGDWLVSYNVQFESNATGRRAMVLHNAADTAGASNLRQGGVTSGAVSGGATYLNACRVLHLTSAATYYLNVCQTSGAALSTYGYIRAYRLK